MSIEVSKVVAHAVIGDNGGLSVAKLVAYVVLEPGAEASAPPAPPTGQGYTYAQLLSPPVASTPGDLLLGGDEQDDGTDALLLEGTAADDADDTLIQGSSE